MALTLENMGLDFFLEDEERIKGFIGYCMDKGRPLMGYSGNLYLMHHFRDAQICVRVIVDENNKELRFSGLDSHEDSWTYWILRVIDDITPKGSDILTRRILFCNAADGEGVLPIDLINADVLPSFLPDDVMKLQMIGFPKEINYFADEDEYNESCSEWRGGKLGLDDGTVFATGFLQNHDPENKEQDDEADSFVLLRGMVKQLFLAYLEDDMEEKKADPAFIRCIIGTKYGDLEICHTLFQVDEEQRDNIKIGAIVSGVFVLSGDVALDDRSPKGAVFNEESDLRVFRQAMEKGDTCRLKTILTENAEYISEGDNKSYTGYEAIKEKIEAVNACWGNKLRTYMAVLTNENGEDELEYKAGKRCVVTSYDEGKTIERILFLDVNENGIVERFVFSNNSKYTFKIDEAPEYSEPDEDEDEDDLRELLAEFATDEGRERIRNRIHLNHLRKLCDCYSTGDFSPLFFFLSDDVVLESQWVKQPNVGREAVEEYFTGKGKTLKEHDCCPECRIVRLIGDINPVEGEVSVNGDEPEHAKVGLLYPDGKLCMYMSQTLNGKTNGVIVDVTMDDRNMISRIDLCMPELFCFEPYEE